MTPIVEIPAPLELQPTYSLPGDAEYDRNEMWNRLIDRENRLVRIEGKQFAPSWVLFCMDRPAYGARIESLKIEREERIKRTVVTKYPAPIAHSFDRFENGSKDHKEKLDHLRNTWEACITTLFAFVVGEARLRRLQLEQLKIRRANSEQQVHYRHVLTDSLAMRLDVTKAILEHAAATGTTFLVSKMISISTLERIRTLNQVRNTLAHRSPVSPTQARRVVADCQGEVVEILAELRGLRCVSVIRYLSHRGAILQHERFRGTGLRREIRDLQIPAANRANWDQYCFEEGRTLAVFEDSTPICLQPFICCKERESGHFTRLCFFKQISSGGQFQYEDLAESEFVSIDPGSSEPDIEELRNLFGVRQANP